MNKEKQENVGAMMEITELFKNSPEKALRFLEDNVSRFTKEGLFDILTEAFRSINHDINYEDIFWNMQIELDEKYDEAYLEYASELEKDESEKEM